MTIKKITKEVLQWTCPICNKNLESMSESQLEYWAAVHTYKCKKNHKKEDKKDDNN